MEETCNLLSLWYGEIILDGDDERDGTSIINCFDIIKKIPNDRYVFDGIGCDNMMRFTTLQPTPPRAVSRVQLVG